MWWTSNKQQQGQRQLMGFWAALGGWERWSFLSAQRWWGPTWSTVSSSGLCSTQETCTCWRGASKWSLRDRSLSVMRKGWNSWDCSSWRREFTEDLINVHEYLKRGCEELRGRLFPVMFGEAEGLKHRQFHLNVREHFSVRVAKHWHGLPREVEKSPWKFWTQFLETNSRWSCRSRKLDKVTVRGPFQIQQLSVFVNLAVLEKPPMNYNVLLMVRIQDIWFSLLLHTMFMFLIFWALTTFQPICWPDFRLQFNVIKEKILS